MIPYVIGKVLGAFIPSSLITANEFAMFVGCVLFSAMTIYFHMASITGDHQTREPERNAEAAFFSMTLTGYLFWLGMYGLVLLLIQTIWWTIQYFRQPYVEE